MSAAVQLGSAKLLPVKEAADFVPYSRDYVSRLAREGKIVAAQIDRQWFVDVISLQNFYTQSTLEESIRKRHLSSSRKRDLEVKEVYRARLSVIAQKHTQVRKVAVVQTVGFLACGVAAGFLFIAANSFATQNRLQSLAQIPWFTWGKEESQKLVVVTPATETFMVRESSVIVTDETFAVDQGIVLLPATASSSEAVTDFFSDPVIVEMTGETSGIIRNTINDQVVPFVRIPQETSVVPDNRNEVTP